MKKYLLHTSFIGVILLLASCIDHQDVVDISKTEVESRYAIAYNVLTDSEKDNYEVFTMNMDGSDKRNVTRLSGVEWSYFSFHDQLYFLSDKDTCQRCAYYLYETNYKGEHPRKISDVPLADSWMSSRKNGNEIIIKPHKSIDSVFYIIDLNGKVLKKVNTGLPYAFDPAFSPDGKTIAFRGANKKSKREEDFDDEIYIINDDGTGLKKLTEYPQSDTTAQWYSYKAGPPQWHPTDHFISYASFQNGKYSLYGVTPDGKKNWKLTDNPYNEVYHSWSPDGNWLVTDLSDTLETKFQIGLMNWKSREMKILTDTSYSFQQAPNFVMKTHH